MSIYAYKSRLEKIEQRVSDLSSVRFELYRDEKCGLHIKHAANDMCVPSITLRPYQLEVQQALFEKNVKRFFLVRPRRSGKEVESWSMLIQAAIECPGLYFMIYPSNVRARAVLWDGAILDMETNESIPFRSMIPKAMKPKFNDQEMKIKLLANGSVIHILGSDTAIDKLRGTNPRGVVFSEYAFSDPRVFQILNPALIQNGGWAIIQTTYNGMNHAYRLMQSVKHDESWYCREDSVLTLLKSDGERYVTDAMIEQSRKDGLPEYLILQEYYSIVKLNESSMYFAVEIGHADEEQRIRVFPVLPNRPVYTFYDLGKNDQNCVTMTQFDDEFRPYIVNYFEDNNKALRFYVDKSKEFCARHGLVLQKNFAPHDGAQRDWDLNTIVHKGKELGQEFVIVKRPQSKIMAIEVMRRMIYRCHFHSQNAARLIECLSNYQKEFDDKMNIYKNEPLHNWASHGCDSFQTMALAIENKMININQQPLFYYTNNLSNPLNTKPFI